MAKQQVKKYTKEGWKVDGTTKSLEVALLEHYEKLNAENTRELLIENITWKMNAGEVWLIIGPNGGGKADFLNALSAAGGLKITPNTDGLYSNMFSDSTDSVSLERAARLIQEERENDESDYLEGGVDHGILTHHSGCRQDKCCGKQQSHGGLTKPPDMTYG